MKNPQVDRSKTRRGRHWIVLLVAGGLTVALGITGGYAALADGASSPRSGPGSVVPFTSTSPVPSGAVTRPVPATPRRSSPTVEASPDPTALADGVYPTYVRAVDVRGATITVDVLQVFSGGSAHRAAIEDGVRWGDVQYDPVYIRNENPLLRTLPVVRDVNIKFIGVCMEPNRRVGLTELRQETTPFTTTFYYDISVVGGSIESIRQLIAVAGC